MKHWEQTFATYEYNYCNICNIYTKPLQHTSETYETLEIYVCNMAQAQCHLTAWTNGARRCRA
jgi:hypothetical protein